MGTAGGIEPTLEQDPPDRVASAKSLRDEALAGSARRDLVAEIVECASNSGIAPTRFVAGHPCHELFGFGPCARRAGLASSAAIVFLGNQSPVPVKQRVGCHQRVDPKEPFAADGLGPRCESTALSVCSEQAPIAEVQAEYSALRLQGLDDILWAAIDPSGDDQDQELKMQRVHSRLRTQARVLDTGLRATPGPPFSMLESLTFRVARFLAHDGERRWHSDGEHQERPRGARKVHPTRRRPADENRNGKHAECLPGEHQRGFRPAGASV